MVMTAMAATIAAQTATNPSGANLPNTSAPFSEHDISVDLDVHMDMEHHEDDLENGRSECNQDTAHCCDSQDLSFDCLSKS